MLTPTALIHQIPAPSVRPEETPHDIPETRSRNPAGRPKALRAIKAKSLIMVGTKDLLNPEWEPIDAARHIRDVRVTTISPGTVNGHASAGGGFPADVDFLNRAISGFFDLVTDRGKKLHSAGFAGRYDQRTPRTRNGLTNFSSRARSPGRGTQPAQRVEIRHSIINGSRLRRDRATRKGDQLLRFFFGDSEWSFSN
jgi:hypothetical protein